MRDVDASHAPPELRLQDYMHTSAYPIYTDLSYGGGHSYELGHALAVNAPVEIFGLVGRVELNGTLGTVIGPANKDGRIPTSVTTGCKPLLIKKENLRFEPLRPEFRTRGGDGDGIMANLELQARADDFAQFSDVDFAQLLAQQKLNVERFAHIDQSYTERIRFDGPYHGIVPSNFEGWLLESLGLSNLHEDAPMAGLMDVVLTQPTVKVLIDFPVAHSFVLELRPPVGHPQGYFTRLSLALSLAAAYQAIYREEANSAPEPLPVAMTAIPFQQLQRPKTRGIYGVHSHHLEQLCIHNISKLPGGDAWRLIVGS